MKDNRQSIQVRLLYVSHAVGPQTTTVTTSILMQAQTHNVVHGITGVLCQSQGFFFQVLEGERSRVNALYRRICVDKRHHAVDLLLYEEIKERLFGKWSMALIRLPEDDSTVNDGHPYFDRYSSSGPEVMTQLLGWVAAGLPIEMTAP